MSERASEAVFKFNSFARRILNKKLSLVIHFISSSHPNGYDANKKKYLSQSQQLQLRCEPAMMTMMKMMAIMKRENCTKFQLQFKRRIFKHQRRGIFSLSHSLCAQKLGHVQHSRQTNVHIKNFKFSFIMNKKIILCSCLFMFAFYCKVFV
jgi:hypothetical protein